MSKAGKLAATYRALLHVPGPRASSNSVVQPPSQSQSEGGGGGGGGSGSGPAPVDRSVASFYYNQSALDAAAEKKSVRLTPASLLYAGRATETHQLLRSAQYLQRELPVRIAHRVADFRALPFAVGCNPTVLAVHELYMRAFHILSSFPPVATAEDEARYSGVLRQLLDEHKDVITMLAEGFRESGRHLRDPCLGRSFLDKTLTSRLGIRLLCEHHLAMRLERPDFVGVVCTRFSPGELAESRAAQVAKMCEMKYGQAPVLRVDGAAKRVTFSYIPQPAEYMLTELLKNAFRATVEFNRGKPGPLPEVRVTVASNHLDFIIRISDQGGGVPHEIVERVFEYNFSTAESSEQRESFLDRVSESRSVGTLHGFGFGLPVSRAYAAYLGGSLTFETMQGLGTDFYLRLRHIDGQAEGFRI